MSIDVRQWKPEDNNTLVDWCRQEPDLIQQMGFPKGAGPEDVQMKLIEGQIDGGTVHVAVESEDEVVAMVALVQTSSGLPLVHLVSSPHRKGKAVWYARAAKKYLNDKGIDRGIAMIPKNRPDMKRFAGALGFYPPDVEVLVCDNGAGE